MELAFSFGPVGPRSKDPSLEPVIHRSRFRETGHIVRKLGSSSD